MRLSPGIGLDFNASCVDHVVMEFMKSHLSNLVMVIIAVWVGMSSYFVADAIMEKPKFDPWGDSSIQRITNSQKDNESVEVPGVDHVFSISNVKQIHTTGIKCLNEDQTDVIVVGGVVNWFMVVPPGFQHQATVYEGTAEMNPGCTSFNFTNTIPPEVLEEVNLTLETEPYVVMNIQGYTVPYVNGKEDGVRAAWSTENFAFVK